MNIEERNKVIELYTKYKNGKYINYEENAFLEKMLKLHRSEYEEIFK